MKKLLVMFVVSALSLATSVAHASQTLSLEDYYTDGSDKVCIYSNGRTTVSVVHEGGGSCPSKYIKRG